MIARPLGETAAAKVSSLVYDNLVCRMCRRIFCRTIFLTTVEVTDYKHSARLRIGKCRGASSSLSQRLRNGDHDRHRSGKAAPGYGKFFSVER